MTKEEHVYEIIPAGNAVAVTRDGEILSKFNNRKQARAAIAELKETGVINPVKPE